MTTCRLLLCILIIFGLSQKGNTQIKYDSIPDIYSTDNRNNVKFNVFSLLTNSIILSYESVLTQESSAEMRLKLIGLPLNEAFNPSGFGIDIGYKTKLMYFLTRENGFIYRHLLHGAYIKSLVGFHYIDDDGSSNSIVQYRIFNIGMDIGKQYVFNNKFSIDMYAGYHFYGGREKERYHNGDSGPSSDHFSAGDLYAYENRGVSLGLRIGILFNKFGKM